MSSPAEPATVARVVAAIEAMYDPAGAHSWDAVGLVCGDPEAPVRRVLLAVDPVSSVADEAVLVGADLLFTHHPLFLTPVSSVAATTPKGRLVHRLVRAGVALHVAHTNADAASPGVSDALAHALGLTVRGPLAPEDGGPTARGIGRVGELAEPVPLGAFVARVAASLPATAAGVRASGDQAALVRRVAVCGGSGDSLLAEAAAADVDAYVTADLRHHRASESMEAGGPALVDVAHWATEWPFLATTAKLLGSTLNARGTTVEVEVSRIVTDPWTLHTPMTGDPR